MESEPTDIRKLSELVELWYQSHGQYLKDGAIEVDQEAPAPSVDEFAEILQSMSDEEVEQLVQYMEFLIAKRKA